MQKRTMQGENPSAMDKLYVFLPTVRTFSSLPFIIGLLSDMESQLSAGGVGAAELTKAKKRLEQELEEAL